MASDGLRPTGQFFEGVRYVGQAHYGRLEDYVEQPLADLPAVRAFIIEHTSKGANVQIHQHKWTEQFIAYGWHPARKRKATP